jgi:predicted nuclease of restriction endonuclease-like (RecB) superfamily
MGQWPSAIDLTQDWSDRSDQVASHTHPPVETARVQFPLSWSDYVRLLSVEKPEARAFYEAESLRGGWTVRHLDRQIGTQFYERTLLSRDKAAMLRKGQISRPEDVRTPEEVIKDPFILDVLDFKDEYSESDLEGALIRHLETFLPELGDDFTFVGRRRRLRIDDE